MLQYRLYFFDGAGHVANVHEFEAAHDEGARSIAEAWREGRKMELWNLQRKVGCWGFPDCQVPGCTQTV